MREFGSQFGLLNGEKIFTRIFESYRTAMLFRSGRDAIAAVGKELIQRNIRTVSIPALICESMYKPLTEAGMQIHVYDIREGFVPDWNNLIPSDSSDSALFVMDFYGADSCDCQLREIKKRLPNLTIIRDITHSIYDFYQKNPIADYYVASLRKTLPIVCGGILFSKKEITERYFTNVGEYAEVTAQAITLKKRYSFTKDAELKRQFRSLFFQAETILDRYERIEIARDEDYAYLKALDTAEIRFARKENYRHLYDRLTDAVGFSILTSGDLDKKATPFSLPILIEKDRDFVQRKFAEQGLYAPQLWPLSDVLRTRSQFAAKVESQMLSIPIDQRYDYADIEDIARIIREVCAIQ